MQQLIETLSLLESKTTVLQSLLERLLYMSTEQSVPSKEEEEDEKGGVGSDECYQHVASLLQDRAGSHLIECILQFAPLSIFSALFSNHFQSRLLELSLDPVANFCVQKLLLYLRTQEQVKAAVDELKDSFAELFKKNRYRQLNT